MKSGRCTRTLVTLGIFLTLVSCAGKDAGGDSAGMSVQVELREMHRCSRISPEITVADAPDGTAYFDIRLVEYGEEERFLGGGSWPNDGSGQIPEGALTKHYRGPCPPSGRTKDYAFIVSAMPRNNAQPTAVRIYRFTQE
ncbi:MAG: MbtF [Desulfovibrio sp.]|nr:MbtF [Desulfovibrio sp.]